MAKTRKKSQYSSHLLGEWGRFNVPQLMVDNQKADEINIFGPIVTEDTAEFWQWWFETDYYTSDVDIQQKLAETNAQQITLIFNSPGGDVWGGSAIRSFIQTYLAQGRTFISHVVGVAASAASLIAVAAPKIIMADMAKMMIHRASVGYDCWGYGNEDDLQIAINDLESRKQSLREINKAQVQVFMDRMGKSREEVQELLRKETWFNAQSAIDQKLADEIQPSGVTIGDIQPRAIPDGFKPTAYGGIQHERPAYSFAAALGVGKDDDDDDKGSGDTQKGMKKILTLLEKDQQQARQPTSPEPSTSTSQGVSSMYESDIRQALGIPAGTEITVAHCYQYIAQLKQENEDLKAEKKKIQQQAAASTIKTFFDAQVERGAMTPVASATIQGQLLLNPDPEAQFELLKPVYEDLPDGDKGGATARKAKGSGKAPEGADGTETSEEETKRMAYEMKLKIDENVEAGMELTSAQDAAIKSLSAAHTAAYQNFDFDNDDEPPVEVD